MSQERLNGLVLLNSHREIDINLDQIIERFSKVFKKI